MAIKHWLLWLSIPALLQGASLHYDVTLYVDLESHTLRGRESIRFTQAAGTDTSWDKPDGMVIKSSRSSTGGLSVTGTSIRDLVSRGGEQVVEFEYSAKDTKGLHWLANEPGVFSTFYCSAWMICSMSPANRVTLKLEVVVSEDGYRSIGPGIQEKTWRNGDGQHWIFETPSPVQTYLFSFAVARLEATRSGRFSVFATQPTRTSALKQTQAAAAFLREKTGIDPVKSGYSEVFLPQSGVFGQEAAQFALMTQRALENLESKGDVVLMTHELAHQWWGVAVGIRSWSDFWLNEGVAEYVSLLYLEHVRGREAFVAEIEKLQTRLKRLTAAAPDRPLHFENWKSASDALGELPYVKGALFLHELRSSLGDDVFWRAMARYSQRNQGKLVDSSDLQRAFEEISPIDLRSRFQAAVYGVR